jgi:putative heme-binding domain-containing protein
VLHLNDGRTLSGFVTDRNEQVIVVKAADGQSSVVNAAEVEEIARLDRSLMPEEILSTFTAQQVRDLFAYLRSSQPLP